jgi:hypothetical protein
MGYHGELLSFDFSLDVARLPGSRVAFVSSMRFYSAIQELRGNRHPVFHQEGGPGLMER